MLLGLHFGKIPWGLHLTYYRYVGPPPEGIDSQPDWVNFSFEYRF